MALSRAGGGIRAGAADQRRLVAVSAGPRSACGRRHRPPAPISSPLVKASQWRGRRKPASPPIEVRTPSISLARPFQGVTWSPAHHGEAPWLFLADVWLEAITCAQARSSRSAAACCFGGRRRGVPPHRPGRDVARALAERRTGDSRAVWQTFWFFAATLAWSLSAWYWARVMLRLRLPGVPAPSIRRCRACAPGRRACSASPPRRASRSPSTAPRSATTRTSTATCRRHAALLRLVVGGRRRCAPGRRIDPALAVQAACGETGNLRGARVPRPRPADHAGCWRRRSAAAVVFFVRLRPRRRCRAAPATRPRPRSSLIAAAGWTAVASTLDFIGMRLHGAGLLRRCSRWRSSSASGTTTTRCARSRAARPQARQDLRASLETWLAPSRRSSSDPNARVPLYLVNAEGGGIRAAYWTVTVLGEIQKRHPAFAEHLYSLVRRLGRQPRRVGVRRACSRRRARSSRST